MPTGIALAVASAVLTAASLPPWDAWWLVWVALTPLLAGLRGAAPRRAFALGFTWGVAHHWATAYWMLDAISTYYEQPFWFAVAFGIASSVLYRGILYGGLAALIATLQRHRSAPTRAWLIAAAWVAAEWIRATGPTQDPWLLLGYALLPYRQLVQCAALGGVSLLTFLVVLVNASLVEVCLAAPRDDWRRRAATGVLALLAVVAATGYGGRRLARAEASQPAVALAIVQGNNDTAARWAPGGNAGSLDLYVDLSRGVATRADLLIWPESALTFFLAREDQQRARIERFLDDTSVDLIVGAPHFTSADPALPEFLNSAFYMTPQHGITDRYDKVTLLPFAEYYPLWLGNLVRRDFARVKAFTPGTSPAPIDTRFGPVAVAICFEAVHAEQVRRMAASAVALVNLSNDGWLGDGAGPPQHFAMSRVRAIENDLWLARATTTGVSAVVDPTGGITARSERNRTATIESTIVARATDTPYARWGDWCAKLSLVTTLVAIGGVIRRRWAGEPARP